jgi:hypothetical protein
VPDVDQLTDDAFAGTLSFIAPELFGLTKESRFTSRYTNVVDI